MEEKIEFMTEDGPVSFYVLEETKLFGVNYLLVAENKDEDSDAYILKDVSTPEDKEAVYEMVEDDETLSVLSDIFAELLEDTDIE